MKTTLLIILSLLFSCSTKRPSGATEAEILFKEAQILVDEKRYLLATEKLNTIKSKHPYSYFATPAELLQADIYFKQESYVEAAAAYLMFVDFHPKHQEIPYVIWRIGESFFNQLPSTFDRDLTPAQEAIKHYQDLVLRYPDSQYVAEAKNKILRCEQMLMQKEKYIADFYYKTGAYAAARFHYLDILNSFKAEDLVDFSLVRALEASIKLKEYDECVNVFNEHGQLVSRAQKDNVLSLVEMCRKLK